MNRALILVALLVLAVVVLAVAPFVGMVDRRLSRFEDEVFFLGTGTVTLLFQAKRFSYIRAPHDSDWCHR